MLIITVRVEAPPGAAIGIKEDLAAYLERFGDVRTVAVKEETPEQLTMWGASGKGGGSVGAY